MEKLKDPKVMGKKILSLLEKDKILLLQDKSFPSIVSKIIGQNIVGSWWGHPMANPIYNGLRWLEDHHPVLIIKLISGKVTYVHESLFADIYSIVREPRDWQLKKLNDDDQAVLKYIQKKKKVVSNDPQLMNLVKDAKKSLLNLEKKLLVYSSEEHTESGKHIKEFKIWKDSKISASKPGDYTSALKKIEKHITKLSGDTREKVKLPWV